LVLKEESVIDPREMEVILRQHTRSKIRLEELEKELDLRGKIFVLAETPSSRNSVPISCSERLARHYQRTMWEREAEKEALRLIVDAVERAISCLRPEYRSVIDALYIQGMTYDRACEYLDIARTTLNCRRKKAIAEMCELIQ